MSPGAVCVIFLIPMLNLILPRVQTRFVLTFGFLVLGCSMLYSRTLTPDIDFRHLMFMRIAQSLGIGFLFVPLSMLAYGPCRARCREMRPRCSPCSATCSARWAFPSPRR